MDAIVSYQIRLAEIDQLDKELIGWLKDAYNAA